MKEVDDINYDFFEDDFIRELDSWFTADIKCCNNCYEDFLESWPISLDWLFRSDGATCFGQTVPL